MNVRPNRLAVDGPWNPTLTELMDDALVAAAEEIAAPDFIDPPTELERHANLHRRAVEKYEERAAFGRESNKTAAGEFKHDRKLLREKYQADLARLKEHEATQKAATLAAIHTAERLAAASRAALREIESA